MQTGNTMMRSQSGMGLPEVLVSMVIFALLATSALYFFRGQNQAVVGGTDLTRAAYIGKQKLDSLKVIDYRMIAAGSDTVSDRYVRAWYVTTMAGRKKVEMCVFWPLTGTHNLTLYTIIGDDQYKL